MDVEAVAGPDTATAPVHEELGAGEYEPSEPLVWGEGFVVQVEGPGHTAHCEVRAPDTDEWVSVSREADLIYANPGAYKTKSSEDVAAAKGGMFPATIIANECTMMGGYPAGFHHRGSGALIYDGWGHRQVYTITDIDMTCKYLEDDAYHSTWEHKNPELYVLPPDDAGAGSSSGEAAQAGGGRGSDDDEGSDCSNDYDGPDYENQTYDFTEVSSRGASEPASPPEHDEVPVLAGGAFYEDDDRSDCGDRPEDDDRSEDDDGSDCSDVHWGVGDYENRPFGDDDDGSDCSSDYDGPDYENLTYDFLEVSSPGASEPASPPSTPDRGGGGGRKLQEYSVDELLAGLSKQQRSELLQRVQKKPLPMAGAGKDSLALAQRRLYRKRRIHWTVQVRHWPRPRPRPAPRTD